MEDTNYDFIVWKVDETVEHLAQPLESLNCLSFGSSRKHFKFYRRRTLNNHLDYLVLQPAAIAPHLKSNRLRANFSSGMTSEHTLPPSISYNQRERGIPKRLAINWT